MPLPYNVIQVVQAHSTAGPVASITATIAATQPGSFLVAVFAANVVSAFNLPAGWTTYRNDNVTGLSLAVFGLPKAPTGTTSVVVTTSGSPQGAALTVIELAPFQTPYAALTNLNNGNSNSAGNSVIPLYAQGSPVAGAMTELDISAVCHLTATETYAGAAEWQLNSLNNASTGGATNVVLGVVFGPPSFNSPSAPAGISNTISLSATVQWLYSVVQLFCDGGGRLVRAPGNAIMASSSGYAGAIGGR